MTGPTVKISAELTAIDKGFTSAMKQLDAEAKKTTVGLRDAGATTQKFGMAALEASRGLEDFASQFSTGGFAAGLRGASNNISQLALSLGGVKAAVISTVALVGVSWLTSWANSKKAIDGNTSSLQSFIDRLAEVAKRIEAARGLGMFKLGIEDKVQALDQKGLDEERIRILREQKAVNDDLPTLRKQFANEAATTPLTDEERATLLIRRVQDQVKSGGGLRGEEFSMFTGGQKQLLTDMQTWQFPLDELRKAIIREFPNQLQLHSTAAMKGAADEGGLKGFESMMRKAFVPDETGKQTMVSDRMSGIISALRPLSDELSATERHATKLAQQLEVVQDAFGKLDKAAENKAELDRKTRQMQKPDAERPPPSDLPPGETIRPGDLPPGEADVMRRSASGEERNIDVARRIAERAFGDLRRQQAEERFGREGGRFSDIIADLEEQQRKIKEGFTIGGSLTPEGTRAMGAVNDVASNSLREMMRSLEPADQQRKASFVGIEEMSKQIQAGAIETKAERYQKETAENTKNLVKEIIKTQSKLEKIGGARLT